MESKQLTLKTPEKTIMIIDVTETVIIICHCGIMTPTDLREYATKNALTLKTE